jgi:hypothetical protein
MKRTGKRFNASFWSERLAPVLLILLALALVGTVVITVLSMLGLTPGF